MKWDYVRLAVVSIRHRKLRSWLTMIGIFIGVAAVVSLISLGQGLQKTIDSEFQRVGGNRIIITPGGGGLASGSNPMMSEMSSAKLTQKDLDVIRDVRGVEHSVGILVKVGKVEFDGERKYATIFGVPTDEESKSYLMNVDFMIVEDGRYLTDSDKNAVIVGYTLTKDFFKKPVSRRSNLVIEGQSFEVVGLNKEAGNPFHDEKVSIPMKTLESMFNTSDEFSMIAVETKDGFNPGDVAEDIKGKLRRSRNVKRDEEDFSVQTAEQLVQIFKTVLGIVSAFLTGIAAISLFVGGIGIMNTMYTSVIERTQEIGIMKAVGARNSDIMSIFMIESGILGLIGGLIGIAIGAVISKSLEPLAQMYVPSFHVYFDTYLILGALLFSLLVGSVSGITPALKAARLKPVDALGYGK